MTAWSRASDKPRSLPDHSLASLDCFAPRQILNPEPWSRASDDALKPPPRPPSLASLAAAQETNLELGFPANVVHVIDKDSFLYQLSLLEMDTRMMEILLFVDGIDAMTSKYMSARLSYSSSDIELNR
eukprot:223368-Chlamydomonas_euryale.AAC.2